MNSALQFVSRHVRNCRVIAIVDGGNYYVATVVKNGISVDSAVDGLLRVDKRSGKVEEYSMFNPEYKKIYKNIVYKQN